MYKIIIWIYAFIPIIFLGCYSVDGISYYHEFDDERKYYAYNGIWNDKLLPYYYDNKLFFVNLSSEVYFNVPSDSQIRNNYNYFTVFFYISSKETIDNININICEIEFENYIINFYNDDLKYYIYQTYNENSNLINYEIIFSKRINKNDYNKNIKNIIKNSTERKYIFIKMDINYSENGDIKYWADTIKLNAIHYENWYTPANLWGWKGVDTKYR
jgi:hypothetical protein